MYLLITIRLSTICISLLIAFVRLKPGHSKIWYFVMHDNHDNRYKYSLTHLDIDCAPVYKKSLWQLTTKWDAHIWQVRQGRKRRNLRPARLARKATENSALRSFLRLAGDWLLLGRYCFTFKAQKPEILVILVILVICRHELYGPSYSNFMGTPFWPMPIGLDPSAGIGRN